MSRFNEKNFYQVISLIESMEMRKQNIWIPVGILEVMYDDDIGYIDNYFQTSKFDRNKEKLWQNLNQNFDN